MLVSPLRPAGAAAKQNEFIWRFWSLRRASRQEENKEFLPCNGLVASQQKQQLFRPSYVKSIFFLTWSKFFLHIGTSGRVREVAKEQ